MSGKHTPGPWRASRKSVFVNDINNRVVAEVVDRKDSREANAHLLAAAPDLLDFVKWVADQGEPNNQMEIFKRARLLAAKAEGRAP